MVFGTKLPKKVALGELYAKYSLFEAHAGNSFCCNASASASSRFQGNCLSMAVGVVTRVSPAKYLNEINFQNREFSECRNVNS